MDRKNYFSGAPMEQIDGYSRMVQAGPFLFCGGTTSVQPDGSVIAEGDSYGQVKYVLEKLLGVMKDAGAVKEDVYSVKIYATPDFVSSEGFQAYSEIFSEVKPLLTCVTIHKLTRPTQLVEIEMNAIIGSGHGTVWEGIKLERKNFSSGSPLEEKLGYSRMVQIGPFVYVGGTTSVQPDKTVYGEDDASAQCKYIFEKQFALLNQAGATPKDIVKVKKYVTEGCYDSWKEGIDPEDLIKKSAVFSEVIIEKLTRPAQLVEIELFAIMGSGGEQLIPEWGNLDFRKEVHGSLGGWAEYVKTGPFLYGGLQHCVDENGNVVGVGDSERQESYVVQKFTDDMKSLGYEPEEMVKFKAYYTTDFGSLYGETEIPAYERIYKPIKPLYTGVYVSRVGQKEEIFEMEMMAVKGAVE